MTTPTPSNTDASLPPRRGGTRPADRRAARRWPIAAGLVVTAGLVAASLAGHAGTDAGVSVEAASTRTLSCAGLAPKGTLIVGTASDRFTVTPLGTGDATATQRSGLVQVAAPANAAGWTLQPVGAQQPTGGVLVTGDDEQWSGCQEATRDSFVNVADASHYELVLVNPDPMSVSVNLTFHDSSGVETVAGARGLVVQPASSRVVPLSIIAASGPTGIEVATDSGRVLALARPITTQTAGPQEAQQAATTTLLAAQPAGSKKTVLMLTNPGSTDATVSVSGLTGSGQLSLAGAQNVTVPAGKAIGLDVSKQVAGEEIALLVRSDQPVVASAQVTADRVVQVGAAEMSTSLTGIVPAAGRLRIANPGSTPVSVDVTIGQSSSQSRTVAPGSLVALDVPAGSVVRISATGPVGASVALTSGKTVEQIVPLQNGGGSTQLTMQTDPGLH